MSCQNFDCFKCDISLHRKNIVYGSGNTKASMMFIGEAPGAKENTTGKPFVGKSGSLLRAYLEHFGFDSNKHIYMTNVIKCRPPGNRDPNNIEIVNCMPNLVCEIQTVKPKIIVTLGKIALSVILGTSDFSLHQIRGNPFIFNNMVIMPLYHPAYILMNLNDSYDKDFKTIKILYKSLVNPMFL